MLRLKGQEQRLYKENTMMKNKFWIFLMSTLLLSEAAMAEAVVKKLPVPVVAGGKPLMETIGERKTIREFKAQNVDDQTLSEILWVAFGISHDGKRTIPTAMNQQNLKVYVVRNDGAWLYDAAENSLTQVTAENLQPLFATQDFMKDVPVNLVYVGSDEKYSPMHAGSAYQNVGLYAVLFSWQRFLSGRFPKFFHRGGREWSA